MSPETATALIVAITAALTSVVVPLYLRRQAVRQEEAEEHAVTFGTITTALNAERDRLTAELRVTNEEHRAKLREMIADYDAQLTAARARISSLEAEVADLRTRLRARGE